MAVKGRYFTVG